MGNQPPDLDEPVEIGRFFNVNDAELVVSVLAGSDIDAFIDMPFTGTIAPYYLIGSGGVRVVVRRRDQDRAFEVLDSIIEPDEDE